MHPTARPAQPRADLLRAPASWQQPVVGLSLRRDWIGDLLDDPSVIDFVEVYAENWWWRGTAAREQLVAIAERIPTTSHGMSVPLCGPEDPPVAAVDALGAFLDAIDAAWWSEHIGIAHHRGENLHEILPVPFTPELAQRVARRANAAQQRTGRPLLIEHGAAYFRPPGSTLSEPAFLRQVLDVCDAHLLLDVNNLYINSQNWGFDPIAWLDEAPLDRVAEIHLGGFTIAADLGLFIDSHAAAPVPPVWDLLHRALLRTGPRPVLVEWDHGYPGFSSLLDIVERVRAVWRAAAAAQKERAHG